MADEQVAEAGAEEKPKGGKLPLIIVIVVVLLAAAGGAAFFLLSGGEEQPAEGDEAAAEAVPVPLYMKLEEPFTTSVADGYVQMELSLMAYDQAALDAVRANLPAVRSEIVVLMSNQKVAALRTREGKTALLDEIRAVINDTIAAQSPDAQIEGVLFGKIVMQ